MHLFPCWSMGYGLVRMARGGFQRSGGGLTLLEGVGEVLHFWGWGGFEGFAGFECQTRS